MFLVPFPFFGSFGGISVFDVLSLFASVPGDVEEGEDLEPCMWCRPSCCRGRWGGRAFPRCEEPVYVPVEALTEGVLVFALQPRREDELMAELAVTILVSDLQVSDCPRCWVIALEESFKLFSVSPLLLFPQG